MFTIDVEIGRGYRILKSSNRGSYDREISILENWQGKNGAIEAERTVIVIQGNRVKIRCPLGLPVPLFYSWLGNSRIVISDSVSDIKSEMTRRPEIQSATFDGVGVIESFLFDAPLNNRTLYEQIKKVRSGEEVCFDLDSGATTNRWYWLPALQTRTDIKKDEIKIQGQKYLQSLLDDKSCYISPEFVLPITAGFDSRLMAALATRRLKYRPFTYTFRRGWSLETWFASRLAKRLQLSHVKYDLGPDCYRDFAKKVVLNTGGMVTGMHTHGIYCCEAFLPQSLRNAPRVFGHFAGPLSGENTASKEVAAGIKSPADILDRFSKSLYPELVERYREEILADIREIIEAYRQSDSREGCLFDFWRIMERQGSLLSHLFSYHRTYHDVKVIYPFINREALDFFFSLPWSYRYNRQFFRECFNELFPDLYRLPSSDFDHDSLLAKLERGADIFESLANKVKPGQEFVLSPFKYEQHEKNLMNHLSDDVRHGMRSASDFFGVAARKPCFPVWRYSTTKEYYRLAAFGYLFSQSKN